MRSSWSAARDTALAAGLAHRAAERDTVVLGEALGRVLAADLVASTPIPHYASSAMDGWAVAGPGPWSLLVEDAAERAGIDGLLDGEAVEVLTGGLIPPGTFAVLQSEHGMVEHGSVEHGTGRLRTSPDAPEGEPRPRRHVREPGQEAEAGTVLVAAGTRLGPVHLAVAAGGGFDVVEVRPRPRVGLVLTGDEVVTAGAPGPGRVRDSFGPSLPGVIASLGGIVTSSVRVGDSAAATAHAFGRSSRDAGELPESSEPADLLVTTGGTGSSRADHVRALLQAIGAEFLVDGVDVRPGGPALLARLPDGRLVACLPGNPLAALLSVLTLVHPVLAGMLGQPLPPLRPLALASAVDAVRSGTVLRPYRVTRAPGSAVVAAEPTPWHGAAMLRGLADADGVLVCPGIGAAVGDAVPGLDLPW